MGGRKRKMKKAGEERGREKDGEGVAISFPRMFTIARAVPDQSQESALQSGSPAWVP